MNQDFVDWLQKVGPWILGVAVVGVVGLAGYSAFDLYIKNKNAKIEAQIFPLRQKIEEFREKSKDDPMAMLRKDPKASNKDKPTFASIQPDVEALQGLILKYKSSTPAQVAALSLADLYMDQKMHDKAKDLLTSTVNESSLKGLLKVLTQMQLAAASAWTQPELAITTFQALLQEPQGRPFYSEALLKLSLIQEAAGLQAEAQKSLEKLVSEHPDTQAAEQAKAKLRWYSLKNSMDQSKGSQP